jgi:hypothetical protein
MATSHRRIAAAAVPFAVTLALFAAAGTAQAHTWATCRVSDTNGGDARCVGTIGDHVLSAAPTEGSVVRQGNRALLSIRAWPLVSVFTRGIPVTASLTCVAVPGLLECSGTGDAGGDPVWVHAAGAGDGRSTVIVIADDSSNDRRTTPDAASSSQQNQAPRRPRSHRHHKARRHHTHRRHHRSRRHDCHR